MCGGCQGVGSEVRGLAKQLRLPLEDSGCGMPRLLDSRNVLPALKSLKISDAAPLVAVAPARQGRRAKSAEDLAEKRRQARRVRWDLKWHSDELKRLVLFGGSLVDRLGVEPKHFKSSYGCHRRPRYKRGLQGKDVRICWTVNYSKQLNVAFYQNQFSCGSPWTCPVCAAKIAERRRAELKDVMNRADILGYDVFFMTLTIRHGMGDDLKKILGGLLKAYEGLSSGHWAQRVHKMIGYIGTIRVLEVTHGSNGFHPHIHVLIFVQRGVTTAKEIEELYAEKWIDRCRKKGLPEPVREIACHVQGGKYADDYVTKWGMIDEMVRGHQKEGKVGGRTPWQLLRDSMDGDKRAGELFLIYGDAFFGKRQLSYSTGLREKLLLPKELSDEEIVNAPETNDSQILEVLDGMAIEALVEQRLLSQVLDMAEYEVQHNVPGALHSFIASAIAEYYSKHKGRRAVLAKRIMYDICCEEE